MFSDDGCPRVTKTAEKRGARRHQDVPTSREVFEERERERERERESESENESESHQGVCHLPERDFQRPVSGG
jgi:hypothetical protein